MPRPKRRSAPPGRRKTGGPREGAGRPRIVGGSASVSMGLVLSDELARDLELAAGELGITKSELLRRLARRALTEKQQIATIRRELEGNAMSRETTHSEAPRLRTPDEVAASAIDRFTRATSEGASVDASAWRKAISDESRAFALELIQAAGHAVVTGRVVGKREAMKIAKEITARLAGAAG